MSLLTTADTGLTTCAEVRSTSGVTRDNARRAVAAAVRKRRAELGVSQAQVAEAASVSLRAYGDIENGASYAQDTTLAALSRALGWRFDYLMDVRDAAVEDSNGDAAASRVLHDISSILDDIDALPQHQRQRVVEVLREAADNRDVSGQ